jgi:hypothetical protein
MKLYKTAINYTVILITDKKIDKDATERLKEKMDDVIGSYHLVKTNGKIETISKEFNV